MSVIVVVGGQYGGEGKGSITAKLVSSLPGCVLVKAGGPNSAHSFGTSEGLFRVRMMPAGANIGASAAVLPAGSLIHVDCLLDEMEALSFRGTLIIDPKAGIVTDEHVKQQTEDPFYGKSGSTLTGTGAANAARALRRLTLARDERRLQPYLGDTSDYIRKCIEARRPVIVEGAQAFGLSNYHGDYPFVTSRDTTVAAVLSQIGLGYRYVSETILTVKCFPTRNRPGSGELPMELPESFILSHESALAEYGGGTYGVQGRLRRVGLFDYEVVSRACFANSPTSIAVTGLDRLEQLASEPRILGHYGAASDFLDSLEARLSIPIRFESRGPAVDHVLDRQALARGSADHVEYVI